MPLRKPLVTAALVILGVTVLLAEPAWEEPVDVGGTHGPPEGESVRVAANDSGIAAAVWLETTAGRVRPVATRFNGTDWSPPVPLGPTDRDASDADVAVGSDGAAYLIWKLSGSPPTIQVSRHDPAGGGWDAPRQVDDTENPGAVRSPDIAAGNGGVAMAVWVENEVFCSRLLKGFPWPDIVPLSTKALSQIDPTGSVAMDASGHAVAVWSAFEGINFRCKAAHWDGAWGEVVSIETNPMFESWSPQAAMDGTGRAAVAWIHNAGAWEPRAAWYDGIEWEDAVALASPPGVFLPEASKPRVAAAPGGNALVAFEATPGPQVWAATRSSVAGWSGLSSFDDGGVSRHPTVSLAPTGRGFVALHSGGAVRASRWDGTAFAALDPVGAGIGGLGTSPRLANATADGAWLFYHRDDGGTPLVSRAHFAEGGPGPGTKLPEIRKVKGKSAAPGAKFSIVGKEFGKEEGKIWFGALPATILKWKKNKVDVVIPEGAGSVDLRIERADGSTAGLPFSYVGPVIVKVSPKKPKPPGAKLKFKGTDFGEVGRGEGSMVRFGAEEIGFGDPRLVKWSTKSIKIEIPAGAGTVDITVVTSVGESAPVPYTYP